MSSTALIVLIAVIVAAAVVLGYVVRRRATLKSKFGPEYERAVQQSGSTHRAESALEARARRVAKYDIRRLRAEDAVQFSDRWRRVQGRFVDDPAAAVREADALVTELMRTRGYPMGDFEKQAEDLSVDHANVVHHYRQAHAIADRHARGAASTEELRQALVHYRSLFDDLLETHEAQRRPA